jgi:hypothetical protein
VRDALKKICVAVLFLSVFAPSLAFAYRNTSYSVPKGGSPKYKMTKPYVTKQGQFRTGAIKDVSANGNRFDNADTLGMNPKK